MFDTCNARCDIAIRSMCKRSRCVHFRQVSRLNLSNKKKYSKSNAIHSRIKKPLDAMISNDTSDRLKSCCISLAYLLILTPPPSFASLSKRITTSPASCMIDLWSEKRNLFVKQSSEINGELRRKQAHPINSFSWNSQEKCSIKTLFRKFT